MFLILYYSSFDDIFNQELLINICVHHFEKEKLIIAQLASAVFSIDLMQDTYVISDSLVATLKSFLKGKINFNEIFII